MPSVRLNALRFSNSPPPTLNRLFVTEELASRHGAAPLYLQHVSAPVLQEYVVGENCALLVAQVEMHILVREASAPLMGARVVGPVAGDVVALAHFQRRCPILIGHSAWQRLAAGERGAPAH